MQIDLYDFDRTIYPRDCSVDFWRFCMRRRPSLIKTIPRIARCALLYLHKADTAYMKSLFFSFLQKIDNPSPFVNEFWEQNFHKIHDWARPENRDDTPVVVASASPEFLLKPVCDKLNVHHLISTQLNIKTGEVMGINCKGEEKVRRLKLEIPDASIRNVFTDSLKDDAPILSLGKNKFHIIKGKKTLLT